MKPEVYIPGETGVQRKWRKIKEAATMIKDAMKVLMSGIFSKGDSK